MWLHVHISSKLNTFSQLPCKLEQVHPSPVVCWCVYTSMHHFIMWMEEQSKFCFKMKSYQNYNCHTNRIVMQNNQSYIIITFTEYDPWGRCQFGTSFHLILYWNPADCSINYCRVGRRWGLHWIRMAFHYIQKIESVMSNTKAWNWTFVKDFSLSSHS